MSDSVQKTQNTAADQAKQGADAPATEKQKAYIEVLAKQAGVEVDEDMDRGEASAQINALKNGSAVPSKRSATSKDDDDATEKKKTEEVSEDKKEGQGKVDDDVDDEPKSKKAKVDAKDKGGKKSSSKANGEAGDEAKFQNTKEDNDKTGGDVEATHKQAAFIDSLRDQAGEDSAKPATEEHMTRTEASSEIERLKPKADEKQPSALEADTTPAPDSHLAHPENWATGGESATSKQKSYIAVLEKQKGETVDAGAGLSKSEASEKIEELKQK